MTPAELENALREGKIVLTWRPLNGAPPVQIPFSQHWTFKADTCGQFTLSTRDVPAAAEGGESCRS